MEENEENKYTWEKDPTRYLEQNVTDALITKMVEPEMEYKKQKFTFLNELAEISKIPRPAIRYSLIIIDMTSNKLEFPLTKQEIIVKQIENYASNYFEQNPLSQLAAIGTNEGKSFIICEFTSSVKNIVNFFDFII